MRKATAVWLVDNTTLSFKQIAEFCGLHELEVNGIADGEVAQGIKGFDPIANNQLDQAEIDRCQDNPKAALQLKHNPAAEGETKRKGPRYTPLSKRQDRPSAIAWLVKFHPELSDGQISKLVGTTKPTIQSIRDRSHWNIANVQPVDPVALGMCKQVELDAAVAKASKRRDAETPTPDVSDLGLMATSDALSADAEPRMPSNMSGLENFSLSEPSANEDDDTSTLVDADSLFNLPESGSEEDDQPS
jgi:hypothetical protein